MLYCGRPTDRGNPFDWKRFGFCPKEIEALHRWRIRLLAEIPNLRGRDLQCWCPLTSRWCHVDVLLEKANADARR